MNSSSMTRAALICALFFVSIHANAADRDVFFNGVEVSDHNLQVLEGAYDIDFEDGNYWYDLSSGLWGRENGGPEGRIAAGLHIGGAAPGTMAASERRDARAAQEIASPDEMSAEDVGAIVGGLLGLMMMGEMMEQAEQAYAEEQAYYGGDEYSAGPGGYYDDQGSYDYDSGHGSGSQYSDGSWIHSSDVAGGSVGGTSDGCIYTTVAGGWSSC